MMKTQQIDMPASLKTVVLAGVAATAFLLGAAGASAQQPAAAVGDLITVSAEVVAIDKSHRALTLRGPEGNEVSLEVGEEVKNFKEIKVGDTVSAAYYESITISKGVSGTPEIVEDEALVTADKGEKPGMVAADTVQLSVTVINIDRANRIVTLRMDDGEQIKRQVDPAVAAFDDLKIGDVIQITVTRSLAVVVEPKAK